jgi:hypothetical protein
VGTTRHIPDLCESPLRGTLSRSAPICGSPNGRRPRLSFSSKVRAARRRGSRMSPRRVSRPSRDAGMDVRPALPRGVPARPSGGPRARDRAARAWSGRVRHRTLAEASESRQAAGTGMTHKKSNKRGE